MGRGPALVLLAIAGPICYGVGVAATAICDGCGPSAAICFDPALPDHFSPVRLVAATTMAIGAIWLLFLTPWALATVAIRRTAGRRATAGAWSLAVNSAALIAVCLVLRNTPVGIGRMSFLTAWMAWTGALLAACGSSGGADVDFRSALRRWGPPLAVGLGSLAAAIILFRREHFIQCFNGDGIEAFELARSLRSHLLPYWEMEWVGRFGTVVTNPSLINSYWTFAVQVVLGEGELATRLTYWVWWAGIFAASLHMVSSRGASAGDDEPSWLTAAALGLLVLLAATWYTFYVGWNPYTADPANPGVPDALFTLCLLLALDCLRKEDLAGWIVLIALGSLVLYAGPVMFVLTSAAALFFQPVPRRRMIRAIAAGVAVLSALATCYVVWGWLDGSLSGWGHTLWADYIEHYIRPVPRLRSAMWYAGYFLLGCGGVGALGLIRAFRPSSFVHRHCSETAWERTVAAVTVLYLLIVLCTAVKNLHYLGPLMPMPVILWLRSARGGSKRATAGVALAAAVPLIVCIWLCWPDCRPMSAPRGVLTLHRQLGAATTFQTDSYEEACRWLRSDEVARELYRKGQWGWYVGQHTWIHYSQLDADPAQVRSAGKVARPLLVTDRGAPSAEYEPLWQWGDGIVLYCRDEPWLRWAASRRPPAGADRYPRVFQPIAIAADQQ